MRNPFCLALLVLPLLSLAGTVCAAEAPQKFSGLAMHGTPKLDASFTHLGYANPAAPKGGTLRLSAIGSFDTVNPFSLKGKSAQGLNYVYDRLMGRSWDEPFTLYPLIAERAEMPDDRSSLTIYVNPKARFQDDTPITADDVIFTFNTLKEKGRPNMRQVYKLVNKVEKIGTYGVKFSFSDGHDRETPMILAMMPIISKAYWSKRDFDKTTLTPPVSTGPYKIAFVDPGRRIVYERNPNYWAKDLPVNKGLYNFDRISFDYFRDETVAFEAFKSGNIDVRIELDPGRWTTGYDFPDLKNGAARKEPIAHGRVERLWGFVFNLRRAPFDDLRVRKALSLMIDYDWINQNIFHSQYKPTTSFYPNSALAASGLPSAAELALLEPFRADLPPEVFGAAWQPPKSGSPAANRASQKQADQLLKEAGWIIRDGKRVNAKTGAPLRFEILLNMVEDEKVALALKRALARLGIEVTLRTLDTAAFRDRLNSFDYDMTLFFWQNSLSPGTEQLIYWGCESAKLEGRFNYSGICTPATDALARAIPNVRTREELLAQTRALDRVLTHSHIMIPLFYSGQDLIGARAGFARPATTSLYGNVMENWWFNPQNPANPTKSRPVQSSLKRD